MSRQLKRTRDYHRRQTPRNRGSGGGDCTCPEIWCFLPLAPTAGTFDVTFSVGGTSDTITIDYNESQSGWDTALKTHSELTGEEYTLEGGPFPNVALYITWTGTVDDDILGSYPTIDETLLTGSVTMFKFSKGG